MHFQTLIFLFCLSVMLHPGESQAGQGGKPKPVQPAKPANTANTANPDLEITKCDPNDIVLAGSKAGVYYYEDAPKVYKKLGEVTGQKATFKKVTKTAPIQVIRVDVEKILNNGYDLWKVECGGVFKVKATGTLPVKDKTPTAKKPTNKIIPNTHMTFVPQTGVKLGDPVTLKITADSQKFQKIIVNNCSVSEGQNKVEIYGAQGTASNKAKFTDKSTKDNEFVATFEAFRFVSQTSDNLKFECEVLLCTDLSPGKCTDPNTNVHPGSPILYDVSENVKRNTVGGVLAVHLPGEQFNSAGKASSCVSGLLLTTGAVLLQRQFV